MIHTLIKSIPIVLLLSVVTMAQTRSAVPSLPERARELEPFMLESAKRHGIDVRILRSVCFVESRFRTDAVSPKGARGPMQFIPETAIRYGLLNPHDPKAAIDAAARYLRDLLRKFDGRVDLAVAAYNAGEGAVDAFRTGRPLLLRTGKVINPRGLITGGIPPYPETRSYVNQIMGLLVGPHARATQSPVASGRERMALRIRDRNFTLDALGGDASTLVKTKSATNSSFIEIGGPN